MHVPAVDHTGSGALVSDVSASFFFFFYFFLFLFNLYQTELKLKTKLIKERFSTTQTCPSSLTAEATIVEG